MEGFLKLSTAVNKTVLVIDAADHITGKIGLSAGFTTYITKAAGSPASATPTYTELDSTNVKGLYKIALTSGLTDTLGELQVHITGSGMDPLDLKWEVVTYLPGEAVTLQSAQPVDLNTIKGQAVTCAAGVTVLASVGTAATSTAQTGDNYARIGAPVGASISADVAAVQTDTTNIKTRIPAALTGNGNMKSSMLEILTTALTETVGGYLSAGFKKLFDVAVPVFTSASINQTGDAYARLGAPAGASVSADVAAVKSDTGGIKTKTDSLTFTAAGKVDSNVLFWKGSAPSDLISGRVDANTQAIADSIITANTFQAGAINAAAIAADAIGASELASDGATEIANALLDQANGVETGITLRQSLRGILSACVAKLSGAATTTVVIRDANDAKDRVTATVDANGNRSAVTLDLT